MKEVGQCKDEVAIANNFDSFEKAIRYTFNRELLQSENEFINKIIDEAMEKYAQQQVENLTIPVVVASVKITKCKIFNHVDPYKHEEEITKWLSSNKIVIKHTTQSQFKQHNRSSYGDYYTYGTLIAIFYEDE